MNKSRLLGAVCVYMLSTVSGAALVDRGDGLIYDIDRNITWLADANYAKTSGYHPDGEMNWQEAMDWAAQLEYAGFTEWRLPTTMQPDYSCSLVQTASTGDVLGSQYNCMGSEMGHLFYEELGGTAYSSVNSSTDEDLQLFIDIQDADYWSSTPYVTQFQGPWAFGFFSGVQTTDAPQLTEYAWAVHDDDIGAVPIPAAVWLFGSGLLGLIGIARKKYS
jgi:hypothetical protein